MAQEGIAAKTMQVFLTTETIADKILAIKQEIIALDKRRADNNNAIREVTNSKDCKFWITLGSTLIKTRNDNALDLLRKDTAEIATEINKLRSEQKLLVNKHRDAEFQLPYKGSSLKALSPIEFAAIKPALSSGIR